MDVRVYASAWKEKWDQFVRGSKNGTFLFLRDYMDYHAGRFCDVSLVARCNGKLIALLPANSDADVLISHGGLTYGGFVTDRTMKVGLMLDLFTAAREFLRGLGFTHWLYKTIPSIYHKIPAEEDRFALWKNNARIIRRGVLAVIGREKLPLQERRKRGATKAEKIGLEVRISGDYKSFWAILAEMLQERHNTKPVHTLDEIEMLRGRFPENINLYGCFRGTEMVAGVVVYESDQVAHCQYIATNDYGREVGALDLLLNDLTRVVYYGKPWFDFGTSDEDGQLNQGLIDQKEGFGARVVAHDHYLMEL